MFRLFIGFCIFIQVSIENLHAGALLAFMEFLAMNGWSYSSIANHVSAIKALLGLHDFPVHVFDKPKVRLFLRSVQINRPLALSQKAIISSDMLLDIVLTCDRMYMGQVYKAVYLVAFFSFIRLSNFVPHRLSDFDPSRHLAVGDVIFDPPGVKLIIKWSKYIQTRDRVVCVPLPSLGLSPLCPVTALKTLLKIVPAGKNGPLFQIKCNSKWQVLTDSKIRHHFSLVLSSLGLQSKGFTFHSFRRSGASFAFNHQVSLQDIKSHGTWSSDAVWRYLVADETKASQVPLTFQRHLFLGPTH